MYYSKTFWSNFEMPAPQPEYRFHSCRKWRIDYAWSDVKLAVELEGGVYSRGRHVRPKGFLGDIEKYNMLTELGWHLLRYQPKKVNYDQINRVYVNLKFNNKERRN